MSFLKDIQKWSSKVQQEANTKITEEFIKTAKDVVNFSPTLERGAVFSEGLLINQWYPAKNSYDQSQTTQENYLGWDSLMRIDQLKGSKNFLGKDGFLSLTNSVHYVMNAETRGWTKNENPNWRGHIPYAMVAKAVIKAKARNT